MWHPYQSKLTTYKEMSIFLKKNMQSINANTLEENTNAVVVIMKKQE
jgi:hypothetical protein